MSKSLIVVPDYSPNDLNYILEVRLFINDVLRKSSFMPLMPIWALYPNDEVRQVKLEFAKLYSKFIYRDSFYKRLKRSRSVHSPMSTYSPDGFIWKEVVRSDPLDCLNKIMRKFKKWNFQSLPQQGMVITFPRFIEEKKEKFSPKLIPPMMDSFHLEISYLKIREQIVSYIEQKIGKSRDLEELKKLFSSNNSLTFEDFLDKKSKLLVQTDFQDYTIELNKQTNLKMKKRLRRLQ